MNVVQGRTIVYHKTKIYVISRKCTREASKTVFYTSQINSGYSFFDANHILFTSSVKFYLMRYLLNDLELAFHFSSYNKIIIKLINHLQ